MRKKIGRISSGFGRSGLLCRALLLSCFVLGSPPPSVADDSVLTQKLERLVASEKRGRIGLVVIESSSKKPVLSINPELPLKPASVLKIATTAAALELLGPEFTFRTGFWGEHPISGGVDTLTVVGGGDPDFTTEDAWLVARELHKRGLRRIGSLRIDESDFPATRPPSGQRAYRAGSAGLAFNFNSIGVKVCPSTSGKNAVVSVDPWESGATVTGSVKSGSGSGLRVDQKGGELKFVVGGSVPLGECVSVYRSVPEPGLYFGRTFVELLKGVGVQVIRGVSKGSRGVGAKLTYEHASKPLVDIVRDLNHYSNNFIGEQLVLALGEMPDGARDRQVGLDRIGRYLTELGIPAEQVSLADGSGLSHTNRMTAQGVVTVLEHMDRHPGIGPEFEISLSVSSRNGTLRRRDFGGEERTVRGKTGTLDGVSSLAGYVTARSGRRYTFAIIENEIPSKDRALNFENRFVETMYEAG